MTLSLGLGSAWTAGADTPNPVVVELFTSEGCSSCPPGEQALSALEKNAPAGSGSLIVLEWHVDYWDYLGWKDRFGSAEATQRQYRYAGSLPSQVYTPQAVVNGTQVPSYAGDANELAALARRASGQTSAAHVEMTVTPQSGAVTLNVTSRGVPSTAKIQAVLVETGLSSHPTAGENAGQRLVHTRVVRRTQILDGTQGTFSFAVPADVDSSRASLVLLVQDQRSMAVLAACESPLAGSLSLRSEWKGRVVNRSGAGVSHLVLQACSDKVCVWGATDADGNFRFESLPPGNYSLTVGTTPHVTQVSLEAGRTFEQTKAVVAP
jgi:hypothetical protein